MGISFVHRKLFPRKRDLDLLLQTPIIFFALFNLLSTVVDRFMGLPYLAESLSHLSWLILLLEVYFYPKYLYTLFGRPFRLHLFYKCATLFFETLFILLTMQGKEFLFFAICSTYSALFLLYFAYLFLPESKQLHSEVKQRFIRNFLLLNIFLSISLFASAGMMILHHTISLTVVLTIPLLIYTVLIIAITSRAYLAEILSVKEQTASRNQVHDFCVRYALTTREKEVLELVTQKMKNREIAEALTISVHTVKAHMKNLYTKTGINNKTSLLELVYNHQ